jgi:hypothetical protein
MAAYVVGIFILRQEPTSLYGSGGKHIFELIDGVSFVIVGNAFKVETIRCVSL